MIEVELPDGNIAEFPDSMSESEIQDVINRHFGASQQSREKNQTGNMANSFFEPALTMTTALAAEPIAGIAGIAQSLNPFASEGAGARAVEGVRDALTVEPFTDAGKKGLENVGKVIEPLGKAISYAENALGDAAFSVTGSPVASAFAYSVPTAIMELLGLKGAKIKSASKAKRNERVAKIISDDPDTEVARYMLNGKGKLKKDKAAIETINHGFDEGVVSMVKGASGADRSKMMQMVNVLERGKKNPKFQAVNRPSDIVGDSIIQRFRVVRDANRQAGADLDSVAKSLRGQPVDVSSAVSDFIDDLNEMGISFDDKKLKLNFKNSDIEGLKGINTTLNKIIKRMSSTRAPDAYDVHRMKKFIDEQVTYGRSAKGLGGKAERVIKDLRRNLDGILDESFPEYDRVNTTYAETIDAIDDFQASAGGKIDLNGDNASAAIGTLSRRILSNAQSRTLVMDSFKKIQDVAKKNGGVFDDDIISQIVFLDEIERVFGSSAKTSFQGELKKGVNAVAQDIATNSVAGIPAGATIGWLKGFVGKSAGEIESRKIESIKRLLSSEKPKN